MKQFIVIITIEDEDDYAIDICALVTAPDEISHEDLVKATVEHMHLGDDKIEEIRIISGFAVLTIGG